MSTKIEVSEPGKLRAFINAAPKSFVVLTDWMTWGVGPSLKEAAAKAKEAGAPARAKAVGYLVLNDTKPNVSEDCCLFYATTAAAVPLGPLGSLGALMKGGAS